MAWLGLFEGGCRARIGHVRWGFKGAPALEIRCVFMLLIGGPDVTQGSYRSSERLGVVVHGVEEPVALIRANRGPTGHHQPVPVMPARFQGVGGFLSVFGSFPMHWY